jgi:photosystem II stability/assembly factor-like uncharacterized protein
MDNDPLSDGRWLYHVKGTFGGVTAASEVTLVTRLLLALVFGTAVAGPTSAGVNVWTALGPPGNVTAIAINPTDPAVMYAPSGLSVFKTVDGGVNWFTTGSLTPEGVYITAFAVDWRNPGTLYAGTQSAGIFKSTDGGTNWTAINTGIYPSEPFYQTYTLTIDPVDPAIVYAGTRVRAFRTADGGMSWTMLTVGGNALGNCRAIVIDPRNTARVWAGGMAKPPYGAVRAAAVYSSLDGGITWTQSGSWPNAQFISALAIDPTNPCLSCEVVLASVWYDGAFLTFDGGAFWTVLQYPGHYLPGVTMSVAVHPTSPWSAVAGTFDGEVWRSVDHFSGWSLLVPSPGFWVNAVAIAPGEPNTIYAATTNGLWSITFGALAITTPCPLPVASAREYYRVDLSVLGGTPPLTWSIIGGSLPPGLGVLNDPLDYVFAITGVPETSGTFDFTLLVVDSARNSDYVSCSITVAQRARRHLVRAP